MEPLADERVNVTRPRTIADGDVEPSAAKRHAVVKINDTIAIYLVSHDNKR